MFPYSKDYTSDSTEEPRILIIDDEVPLLETLEEMIGMLGYKVSTATRVAEAEKILAREGTHSFDCIVTDYNMPGKTGLELLRWLKEFDTDLSIIAHTGYVNHDDVSIMFKEGAVDILQKPVGINQLQDTLKNAIKLTREHREVSRTQKSVQQASRVQDYLLDISGIKDLEYVDLCHAPLHAAGGDFFASFNTAVEESMLVFADVSGHDLDTAFISNHLNGQIHGMVACGASPEKIISHLNSYLTQSWNDRDFSISHQLPPETSIACIVVNLDSDQVREIQVHGMPFVRYTNQYADTELLGIENGPLGLYDELDHYKYSFSAEDDGELLLWSDGLEDYAYLLGVSPEAVAYKLLQEDKDSQREILSEQGDDIMISRVNIRKNGNASSWHPLLVTEFSAKELDEVEKISAYIQESLLYALSDLSEKDLYAMLLSSREALLNAQKHGCSKDSDVCQYSIHYSRTEHLIRITVADPGAGYDDTYLIDDEVDLDEERNSGLVLIRNFSTSIMTDRRGAVVAMDFALSKG